MSRLWRRVCYWLGGRRSEAELAEELEFHRAHRQADFERDGLAPADAAVASRRVLGNVALAREDARAVWGWAWLAHLCQDVRYGVRLLRRQPRFCVLAVFTLAAGTGATTTVFSVMEAELWKPLPFSNAHRLVVIYTTGPGSRTSQDPISGPDFVDWQSQGQMFDGLAAFRWSTRRILRGSSFLESVSVLPITSNFFDVLRRMPAFGRSFGAGDEALNRVAILSDACWRRLFNADPRIVGTTITLDDRPFEIVGISKDERLEFIREPDLFVPIDLGPASVSDRGTRDLNVVGRLKDRVGLGAAQEAMRTIYQQLANAYPADHVGRTLRLRTLRDAYLGWNWRPLFFFLGAAWFVLLLSCANVANLLLARAMTRQREFAIRGALGGGPGALFRLLFIEGALLAVLGAGTGLLLASWAIRILPHWMPPSYLDRGGNIELDTRVYFFSLLMAGFTAILFGLPPALFAARRQLSAMLAQGGRTATGSAAQRRTRHALVVMEVTTALVLLFGAGLFVNSFIRLTHLPLGFEPQGRLTMRVPVSGARYSDPGRIVGFVNQLIEHIAQVPGVRDAAVATSAPLGSGLSARFIVLDQPRPAAGDEPKAIVRAVSPGFFRTFDIRQLAGRDFAASDADGAPNVAVINERLAHRLFADTTPLGKELVIVDVGMSWVKPGVVQIVGVVANIKDVGLNEADFNDIYVPLAQNPVASLELVVNTSVPPSAVVDVLRQQVSGLDRDLPVYAISTMADRVDDAFREDRFNVLLVGAFAVLAVIVAGVGIYGTMSYATEQRTREFGVRLALGARRGGILTLALGQSARLGAIGTGIGLAVSLVLARLLGSALYLVPGEHDGLIYGVGLADPLTLTCAAMAIVGIAALAGLGPACRATRIDPLVTLRCE